MSTNRCSSPAGTKTTVPAPDGGRAGRGPQGRPPAGAHVPLVLRVRLLRIRPCGRNRVGATAEVCRPGGARPRWTPAAGRRLPCFVQDLHDAKISTPGGEEERIISDQVGTAGSATDAQDAPRVSVVLVDDSQGAGALAVRRRLEQSGLFEVVGEGGDGDEAISLVIRHEPGPAAPRHLDADVRRHPGLARDPRRLSRRRPW